MNRFLYHTSCERCGSSDAKAIYLQGDSFCFSCRSVNSAKISPYVTQQAESEMLVKSVQYPSDATRNYSEGAMAWCKKYEITVEQLLKETIYYSAARDQLIFGFEADGKLLAYQARNLNFVSKSKRYYTCGDVNDLLPIYHCRYPVSGSINEPSASSINTRRLVLVEDCLSAIKVSYTNLAESNSQQPVGMSAMPLLGNNISKEKLVRLRYLYDDLYVFLDGDMYPNAMKIAGQAQLLGFNTKVIYSEKDPKEHDKKSLTSLLT